jgi:hypothetical protein
LGKEEVVHDEKRCTHCRRTFGSTVKWRGRATFVIESFEEVSHGMNVPCCTLCLMIRSQRLEKQKRLRIVADALERERRAAIARKTQLACR